MAKRQWVWAVLVVFALGMAGCAGKEEGRYYNKEKGFSMKLPADWEKKEGFMGTAVISLSLQENAEDNFRENVNVLEENLPRSMSIDEYFSLNLLNLGRVLTDYKEEEKGDVKLDGKDAKWLVYTHTMGQLYLKVMVYIVVKGTKGYVITCTASPGTFSSYRAKFEETALSFKFY